MTSAVRPVGARDEQAWNDAVLAGPVDRLRARFWTYPTPAVVLGRAQRAVRDALPPGPWPIVDRNAGGGAVLVGPWLLGLSIVLPADDPRVSGRAVADGYRWLGDAFVAALADLGIAAETVPPSAARPAPSGLAWACYAGTSPWEVLVAGRKAVGFAQRRSRHGVLTVAGALLSPVPWPGLCAAMGRPAAEAAVLAETTIDLSTARGAAVDGDGLATRLIARVPALDSD